jgi:hypothetical protein
MKCNREGSRRTAIDGGLNSQSGAREGQRTHPYITFSKISAMPSAVNASAANIQKSSPANVSSLPANSRASERELSIRERDGAALICMGVLIGFTVLAIGLLLFAGRLIFQLVDLS